MAHNRTDRGLEPKREEHPGYKKHQNPTCFGPKSMFLKRMCTKFRAESDETNQVTPNGPKWTQILKLTSKKLTCGQRNLRFGSVGGIRFGHVAVLVCVCFSRCQCACAPVRLCACSGVLC